MNIEPRTTYQVWVELDDGDAHPFRMGMSLAGAASLVAKDHNGLKLFVVQETCTYQVVPEATLATLGMGPL